ncbi:FixH family protein [Pseudohalocynthiibacter aestuariivivens]|jgi:nitrogen fixation protein FixH|uniref:FixH family protein n=1 Tax=Pseudohalocynthiibacter aestuariivivens TaxID=1591409 RepID=A0ABV5JI16_9RHOB|nr:MULTISPECIES: FixH family protein [Pseudohalocynthiibacter]MBS9717403.1 FixH family protein [Pseudohalocynthiibacter aestuariivivens]MCK0102263.1 FixH family protein [Pseudohalocynthiibacter sp. F2068]
MSSKPLTGRKVFAILFAAFAVIIGVNVFMAFSAIRTFPGLEVGNSYVASQTFDADRAAQDALGWDVSAIIEANELVLTILDDLGAPAGIAELQAILGRATNIRDDMNPEFTYENGVYRAPVDVAPGNWNLRLVATAEDGTKFQRRIVLYVGG